MTLIERVAAAILRELGPTSPDVQRLAVNRAREIVKLHGDQSGITYLPDLQSIDLIGPWNPDRPAPRRKKDVA